MYTEDEFSPENVLIIFGTNIKKARERKELTKTALATSAQYDRGSLNKLEKGKMNIELATAVKLARALDVPFPALFSQDYMNEKNEDRTEESIPKRYREDDYLLVFREKFVKQLRKYTMHQVSVRDISNLNEQMVSRLVNGTIKNPTIKTLYALAYTVNAEMSDLFSRT